MGWVVCLRLEFCVLSVEIEKMDSTKSLVRTHVFLALDRANIFHSLQKNEKNYTKIDL